MANTNAPFGFRHIGYLGGGAPSNAQSVRYIKSDYTTAIYCGDPILQKNTGYIEIATATGQVSGIFVGCKYTSVSQKRVVWSNYWPGSDATGDIEAYVIDRPDALFEVQAGTTGSDFADLGANVDFAVGTGSSATGISGAYVTSPNTTAGLAFRVVSLITAPPGANGTEIGDYGRIVVTFNTQDYKTLTGI